MFCYQPPKQCSTPVQRSIYKGTNFIYYYQLFHLIILKMYINMKYELYTAYKSIVIVINLLRDSHKQDKHFFFKFLKFLGLAK